MKAQTGTATAEYSSLRASTVEQATPRNQMKRKEREGNWNEMEEKRGEFKRRGREEGK